MKTGVFVKHECPRRQQSPKLAVLSTRSQGHWPWCHLKGFHLLSMLAKYEVSISYGSKVMAKVKGFFLATESQTDRQTESQTGQKLDAPEFHSGHIKMILPVMCKLSVLCKDTKTISPNFLRLYVGPWHVTPPIIIMTCQTRIVDHAKRSQDTND